MQEQQIKNPANSIGVYNFSFTKSSDCADHYEHSTEIALRVAHQPQHPGSPMRKRVHPEKENSIE